MATISELIHLIRLRKLADESPYKLVLGSDIQSLVLNPEFSAVNIINTFSSLSRDERYTLLSAYTTKGRGGKYLDLAHLTAEGYFDIIVTTDPTNELQDALLQTGIGYSDFDIIILGYDQKIENRLKARTPKIKIVKLRGDLSRRSLDNFLPSDALKVNEVYETQISSLIETDSILLGVRNNDFDILRYVRNTNGAIWIIQKTPPEPDGMLGAIIRSRHFTNMITSTDYFPEKIFELLQNELRPDLTNNDDGNFTESKSQESYTVKSSLIETNKLSENSSNLGIVAMKRPMKIFISYSHKDEEFKDELVTMLAGLQRRDVIDAWQDRRIEAGDEWYKSIQDAMDECDLALLLVSPDFIASRFIQEEEVPRVLARREEVKLRVIPIIVRPCMWNSEPVLSDLQPLPKDAKAVITFSKANGDRDQVWADIAKVIEKRAKELG